MKKNVTLMSPSAVSTYVTELEGVEDRCTAQIEALAKVVVTTEASLGSAHEHIIMLEKELKVGSKV